MLTKIKMLALAGVIATVAPTAANAADFNFNYTTLSGVVAKGVVSATNLGGFYTVDNVTGTRNQAIITGYDFYDDTPQSFDYTNGYVSNVDFSYYVGGDNYEIRFPGSGFGTEFLNGTSSLLVTQFSLAPVVASIPAVPEPATWLTMILGMGAIGFTLRSAVRRSERKFDAKIKRIAAGELA